MSEESARVGNERAKASRGRGTGGEGARGGGGGSRFFRGRDFETCLSALKSREIEECRPKPGGGQDRVQTLRCTAMTAEAPLAEECNDSRKKRPGVGRGGGGGRREGWPERAGMYAEIGKK